MRAGHRLPSRSKLAYVQLLWQLKQPPTIGPRRRLANSAIPPVRAAAPVSGKKVYRFNNGLFIANKLHYNPITVQGDFFHFEMTLLISYGTSYYFVIAHSADRDRGIFDGFIASGIQNNTL